MHSRAKDPLQSGEEYGISVKVFTEVLARLLCVNQPNINATAYQLGENSQERSRFSADLDILVLDVSRAYPERLFHISRFTENLFVVVFVLYVLYV